jgi:two-component system sensor histidine kinase UhpB
VQEALTNTIKHAQASRVDIAITEKEGMIRAVIADDGHGFQPSAADAGFGLVGMRERAALAGGEVQISSGPEGTSVRLLLPAEHRGDAPPIREAVA